MPTAQTPPALTPAQLAGRLASASRIYLAGAAGEPIALLEALAHIGLAATTIVTPALPGINRFDLTRLGPQAMVETPFVTPALRPGFERGQVRHLPLHYTRLYRHLGEHPPDAALLLAPPPRNGMLSLGPTQDFPPAFLEGPTALYAAIHDGLPWPRDGVEIPLARVAGLIDSGGEIATLPETGPDPVAHAVAARVASLIRDGDTLQTGIGGVPTAALAALVDRRRLSFHGGLLTQAAFALADAGALSGPIAACVALGDRAFRERVAREERLAFRPVREVHGLAGDAAPRALVAINSAIAVDLFGQVSAETLGGRQAGGHGGLADFCRLAQSSRGGRAVIALPAAARGGTISRIVPALPAGSLVSLQRAEVDYVVTEHGVADLQGANIDSRAEALIRIAAPEWREELESTWRRLRRSL